MAIDSRLIHPRDLRKIAHLQVLARRVVEGSFTGLHKSPHKGFSIEFSQHRQYVQGDEIRRLDWKVFGKTDRFYVREFEEETNLRATVLLDSSGSMGYGEEGLTKHDYAVRLAACLFYLMVQQRDTVGLVSFDTMVRSFIPQRSGTPHLRVLMDTLEEARTGGETALGDVFRSLVPRLHRRGLLIIISDCFGDVKDLLQSLAYFRHAHHEILLFQIVHPDELSFPFRTWTRFECLERPGHYEMVDPAHLRGAYLKNLEIFERELRDGCRRHRVDWLQVRTDQPYAEVLSQFLTRRMGRP